MDYFCEGIGCALRERCELYVKGCRVGRHTPGYHWMACCHIDTRECYMPVSNLTSHCKRMLRTYALRGDFWYYEKAPEEVRLMVNRIDMSELAELYKVTKDRRL